ncbi:outer-membrane lipoprotein carrier protein LolA [Candidatus Pelagibacter sp.]|nr:outer-membrane lipoprotein carrier protein LolA [Candidatus Pelagibacter sp.]|tara:strand:- start:316 stop:864 length:549 start_codon:yes stop_codon:yes gene_type:complete
MKKILFIYLIFFLNSNALSAIKESIINNLINTKNLSFNFEQNINGKIETGKCIIEYPKKIFCKYNVSNEKILVSNGKSFVIKTKSSFYQYSIKRTPLDYILDKNFLIDEIKFLKERVVEKKFINYTILKDENEINIFFDKDNYNLIGWQTLDIYQNLSITYLTSIKKNESLKKDLFELPSAN